MGTIKKITRLVFYYLQNILTFVVLLKKQYNI